MEDDDRSETSRVRAMIFHAPTETNFNTQKPYFSKAFIKLQTHSHVKGDLTPLKVLCISSIYPECTHQNPHVNRPLEFYNDANLLVHWCGKEGKLDSLPVFGTKAELVNPKPSTVGNSGTGRLGFGD